PGALEPWKPDGLRCRHDDGRPLVAQPVRAAIGPARPTKEEPAMRTLAISIVVALCVITSGAAQSEKLQGVTYKSPGGTTLRLMLDESNVGPSVSVGEMIFP